MLLRLNEHAWDLLEQVRRQDIELRIASHEVPCGTTIFDFGIETRGGLDAGLKLAEICLSGLGRISINGGQIAGQTWPFVTVWTDHPAAACLGSQYAGWQIASGKYFAMGSGPMRALAGQEPLFAKLGLGETSDVAVGILETRQFPPDDVCRMLADKCGVTPKNLALLVAPTASLAGNLQIVARSVETALHKLHELGWDVHRVQCGLGTAPLPPVATDDLVGIGRTNDAILYGGNVNLWVTGDDESLREVGPLVPSSSSPASGKPFLQLFEEAGRDFYKLDPHLFSPAEIVLHNLDTGSVFQFGTTQHEILKTSFQF